MKKSSGPVTKMYTVNFSPSLLLKDLCPFIRVTVHWGKGNNHTFWELLDTGSEFTLIPEDPKCHCGSQSEKGLTVVR